jgi:hypothetical protein
MRKKIQVQVVPVACGVINKTMLGSSFFKPTVGLMYETDVSLIIICSKNITLFIFLGNIPTILSIC